MSDAIGEPVSLEPLKESRPSWLKLVKAAANAWVAPEAAFDAAQPRWPLERRC